MKNREDLLEKQLERVDKWLHFAEAKNAALVAFNIAIVTADFPEELLVISTVIKVIISISAMIAFGSFWPNLTNSLVHIWKFKKNEKANNIFFADIAGYDTKEHYLESIDRNYFNDNCGKFSELEMDFSEEIIINSRITVVKYELFRIAIAMDILSVLLIIVMLICA